MVIKNKLFSKISLIVVMLVLLSSLGYYALYQSNIFKTITPLYFGVIMVDIGIIYLIITWFFISKPYSIVLGEIKALLTGRRYNKIITSRTDEIGVIAHFFNQITKSLEKASSDIKDRRRLGLELDIASKIQKETLPQIAPEIKDLSIIAKFRPATEIGGDCFDFITVGDNTYFFIGDVTGHGIPSGLVMMMGHTLTMTFAHMYKTGYEVLVQTNRYLKPLMNSVMFMTMTLFRWNQTEKKLYATGSGHEHILIYKAAQKRCEIQKSGGIALGMVPDNSKIISEQQVDFQPGDVLFLYTDGITEAKNIYGELFGLNRLVDLIEQNAEKYTIEEMFDLITKNLKEFNDDHIQEDDMSLIICKYGKENFVSGAVLNTAWSV